MSAAEFPFRVLVVDDSSMMRALIRRALQGRPGWSAEVIEAADAVEALELIRNPKLAIDVVLLDWNMPRLDGVAFLKALKHAHAAGGVSVIMVTAQSQHSGVAEALRWGARDYLLKPFSEEILREKVARLCASPEGPASDTTVLLRQAALQDTTNTPFLQMIRAEAAQELILESPSRAEPAGSLLLPAGVRTDVLGILLRGQVELSDPHSGRPVEVRGPGDCWGEASFLNREASRLEVRAKGAIEYVEVRRDQFATLVRQHPSMASSLAALVARKNRRTAPEAELSGRLDRVPIADLIQILHLCRKSGHLKLSSSSQSGGVYFAEGELLHAWLGGAGGEEALYDLMGWDDAGFAFESDAAPSVATLTQPTIRLVTEFARRVDEQRRDQKAGPALR